MCTISVDQRKYISRLSFCSIAYFYIPMVQLSGITKSCRIWPSAFPITANPPLPLTKVIKNPDKETSSAVQFCPTFSMSSLVYTLTALSRSVLNYQSNGFSIYFLGRPSCEQNNCDTLFLEYQSTFCLPYHCASCWCHTGAVLLSHCFSCISCK